MDVVVDTLFNTKLTLMQRIVVLYAFVFLGILVAVQISQTQAEVPLSWTRLNKTTKPYWFTLYVLEVLLLFVSTWPILRHKMAGYVNGYEEQILNTVWIGLLSLETLMVLGVAVQGIIKRFGPKPKQKTN